MARGTDPDSASSQFYICDTSQHGLDNGNRTLEDDPGYAVFGVVREGMELVQAAAGVPIQMMPMVTAVSREFREDLTAHYTKFT